MPGLHLIPINLALKTISKRKLFFLCSAVLVIFSIAAFLIKGLNYGIDFKGGIMIEVRQEEPRDISEIRNVLSELGLGEIALQEFGQPSDLLGPCIFLSSNASSYMTGQDIYVDGGWSANGLQSE